MLLMGVVRVPGRWVQSSQKASRIFLQTSPSFARSKAKNDTELIGMSCYKGPIQKKRTPSVLLKNASFIRFIQGELKLLTIGGRLVAAVP